MESNTLTNEELKEAQKLHKIMDDNIHGYISWYAFDSDGTPIIQRLSKSTVETMDSLVETASLNAVCSTGYYGMTIFHHLVKGNYYHAVKVLLERGVDPNILGKAGKGDYSEAYIGVTPLHIACINGNLNMVKLLMEYGGDSSIIDNKGYNCFHYLGGVERVFSSRDVRKEENAKQAVEIAKLLKCDINHKNKKGITPFVNLMKNGNKFSVVLTSIFIELGANVYEKDENENTALMLAISEKNETAANILAKYTDMIDVVNNDGDTALHIAWRGFNRRLLYMLARHGADSTISNNAGENVLQMLRDYDGYQNGYDEYLIYEKVLLNKRLRPKEYLDLWSRLDIDFWGDSYSDINAFFYEYTREIAKKLDMDDETEHEYIIELVRENLHSDKRCNFVNIFYEEGYDFCEKLISGSQVTTIRDLCCNIGYGGNENAVKNLAALGIDLDTAIVDGKTPAYCMVEHCGASESVSEEIINALEYCSVESMEQLNNEGIAAIHEVAGYKINSMLIEYMIKRGVNINLTTDSPSISGETPLHIACRYNNYEVVKALKEAGADDSITNEYEVIPAYCLFEESRYYSSKNAIKILPLLDNVNCRRMYTGEIPIINMYRRSQSSSADYEMTEIFIEKGVDINQSDNRGNTPLIVQADYNNNKDVVKLLLSEGADINARNEDGDSALIYVIKDGNVELARFLIKKGADYNILNARNETPASICIEKGLESILELMTDIRVVPASDEDYYDDDDDYDDYEDDDDDEEDDDDYEEDEEEVKARVRAATMQGYINSFGLEKGEELGKLALRMSEISEEGLNSENMQEYYELGLRIQEIMTSIQS